MDLTKHDLKAAHSDLQSAEQLNPRERGLWGEYGYLDVTENRMDDAVRDFKKEIEYHPENAIAYQALADVQVRMQRTEDAEQTLRDLLKFIPDNTNAQLQLGSLSDLDKKYAEASTLLEGAMKQAPDNKDIAAQAGRAQLLAGKRDAGIETLRNSLKDSDLPNALNNVAYELADFDADLPTAEASSKKAMEILEKQTAEISLANLTRDDLAHVNLLTAVWDTMGWVYFREGRMPEAENYVGAAWRVTQHSEVGDHLGQIFEKQNKLAEAANIFALSLAAETLSPDPSGTDSIKASLYRLKAKGVAPAESDPNQELAKMRTISIPKTANGTADFFLLVSGNGESDEVEDAQFISGDEALKGATEELKKASFPGRFRRARGQSWCGEEC